jgi:UDP-N-acetylglucosamine transferase subunit ALG13
MPFDRLVKHVDEWALNSKTAGTAQIGNSAYVTRALVSVPSFLPDEFRAKVAACDVLIGHAGMGTVLTGLEFGKPMILFPRLMHLKETRNDHQVATLKWLQKRIGIYPAFSEVELDSILRDVADGKNLVPPDAVSESDASGGLISGLRDFIRL